MIGHPFLPDSLVPHLCVARVEDPFSVVCGRPERDHTQPPAAGPIPAAPPPAWWAAPAPPDWVIEQNHTATGWRNAGERRWRADLPAALSAHLLLLVNPDSTGYMRLGVSLEHDAQLDALLVARAFDDLQDALDHEALPSCAAPDCAEKAPGRMVAAEDGTLGGRPYRRGDEIRLCRPHEFDVITAAGGGDVAAWLRGDVRLYDPLDRLDAANDRLNADAIHRNRARVLRVAHHIEEKNA